MRVLRRPSQNVRGFLVKKNNRPEYYLEKQKFEESNTTPRRDADRPVNGVQETEAL